jgi:N-acetyl sugar amidotransferase
MLNWSARMLTKGRICTYCVMDESNPAINFNEVGRCNCCIDAERRVRSGWFFGADGDEKLEQLAATLRREGQGKSYDAIVGLSGGIDSAYLAFVGRRRLGLRLLAVHVDAGWNSEPAVRNIASIVRALDIDLHTHVVEWAEMRDLQRSFLHASVLNQDIPQDHVFLSTLLRTARRFRIRNVLSGVNLSSECVNPPGFGFPASDGYHARAIQRRFGSVDMVSYPFMFFHEYLWRTRVRREIAMHFPLNYMNYDKESAKDELEREFNWVDYGEKHSESRFTKFYQDILLAEKFGFDKRRLHFSSLIVSGQMTRDRALEELSRPLTTPWQRKRDVKFVSKKLGMTVDELEHCIKTPGIDHGVYPNHLRLYAVLWRMQKFIRIFK